ncbi:MAG: hypothetical protein DCC71_26010 [Proteobacteria bacterium]|nr:MAG: hypothetical protein DCC71_26010 [Pseudomonadota bacterium]
MRRPRFDHLAEEISIRIGKLAPRHALWLRMRECGLDPDRLTRDDALAACEEIVPGVLREHGWSWSERDTRAVLRAVARHDPSVRSPAEWASGF